MTFADAQQRVAARLRESQSAAAGLANQDTAAAQRNTLRRPLKRVREATTAAWTGLTKPDGVGPTLRVGQLDAELLDEELLQLLFGQVGDALKYYGVCSQSERV